MPIHNWVAEDLERLTAFRRDLHRHPETRFDTHRTAGLVAAALEEAGCDEVVTGIGRTGVVGVIRGRGDGPVIGLRADMDALPMEEIGRPEWVSEHAGNMHACGHDGHTTMLLGAATHLARLRDFDGTVVAIFQPDEEGGLGAEEMIHDGLFERFGISEVYGMHNEPGLPVGQFICAPGPVMGSVDEFDIRIEGVGGHGAAPHASVDPVVVAGALVQGLQTVVSRSIDPLDPVVLSITTLQAGDAFNVIPATVTLRGTVRTLSEPIRADVGARMQRMVEGIASAYGTVGRLEIIPHSRVTINDADAAVWAAEAAEDVVGADRVARKRRPMMAGEDFAFMLEKVPGAMVFCGNGDSAGLHHPEYDFSDDAIPAGCSYWVSLVRHRLGRRTA